MFRHFALGGEKRMYRLKLILIIVMLAMAAAGLRCGSDSPTGSGGGDLPGTFTVEFEDYIDWYDDEAGSMLMRSERCSQASGSYMVKGLDYPGEWIEVPVTIDEAGTYELTLRYAALVGDTLMATVTIGQCGELLTEPEVDFVMDKGGGLG
jgi:hypothetical protein